VVVSVVLMTDTTLYMARTTTLH